MTGRIPKSLIVALALMGITSLGASIYLESRQLAFLQAHPIMVNLISGVVAFSFGFLALSLGVNWFLQRQWVADNSETWATAMASFDNLVLIRAGQVSYDKPAKAACFAARRVIDHLDIGSDHAIRLRYGNLESVVESNPADFYLNDLIAQLVEAFRANDRFRLVEKIHHRNYREEIERIKAGAPLPPQC